METQNKKAWNIFFVVGSVFLLVVFLVLVIASIYILYGRKEERIVEKNKYDYQVLTYDPSTKEKSVGFTTIMEELGEEDFIFYEVENGNQVLISNYESTTYGCTGTCYCEKELENRRNSFSATRSVGYLLTAASSIVAYQLAREYFTDDCVEKLKDECPDHAIQSYVDECDELGEPKWVEDMVDEQERREHSEAFICKGRCIENRHFRRENTVPQSMQKNILVSMHNYGCDKLEMEERINFGFDETIKQRLKTLKGLQGREQFATFAFSYKDLDEFCRSRSKEEFVGKKKFWKKNDAPEKIEMNVCVGFDMYAAEEGGQPMHKANKCLEAPGNF